MKTVRAGTILLLFVCLGSLLTPWPAHAADEKISDDLLYDRVNRALITDRDLGARQLVVTVKDGKVTVSGYVDSDKHRKKVEKVVKKVKGVKSVDNQTQIRPYR
jgi:osmotically-inducible protein OsmY